MEKVMTMAELDGMLSVYISSCHTYPKQIDVPRQDYLTWKAHLESRPQEDSNLFLYDILIKPSVSNKVVFRLNRVA